MTVKRTVVMIAMLVLTATACNASDGEQSLPTDDATGTLVTTIEPSPPPTSTSTTAPDQEDSTVPGTTPPPAVPPPAVAPLYDAGDIDVGLQPFIDEATDDLATRLGVDSSAISTHAAVLVVWPDASLGCPQPDMGYAQVLTDGSIIELEHDGDVYRYHTGGSSGPFICEQPIGKAPPTELLTLEDFDD